jgi:hypothetical protein
MELFLMSNINDVFFQVTWDGVTYVTSIKKVLKSSASPVMSFDYEILTYSNDERSVYINFTKRDMTPDEETEVSDYIKSIEADEALSLKMLRNEQARDILAKTDWYVIRKQETGIEIPEEILTMRDAARNQVEHV